MAAAPQFMRNFITALIAFLVASATAQEKLPFHPYRKIDGKYFDLSARYSWMHSTSAAYQNYQSPGIINSAQRSGAYVYSPPAPKVVIPQPAKEWIGGDRVYGVVQVVTNGLLVSAMRYANGGEQIGDPFFLTNYPAQSAAVENQIISFLALQTGTYTYVDTAGASRTVALYDYGVPVSRDEIMAVLHPPLTAEQKAEQAQQALAKRDGIKRKVIGYYTKQAESGDGYSQLRLGQMYLRGEGGCETNYSAAKLWLLRALTNGYPEASNSLSAIQSH